MVHPAEPFIDRPRSGLGDAGHSVHFCESDAALVEQLVAGVSRGVAAGDPVIVVATPAHREALVEQVRARGGDLIAAVAGGRAALVDAEATVAKILVEGRADWSRFRAEIERLVDGVAAAPGARVRVVGELVDVLWRDGARGAALRVEEMWHQLSELRPLDVECVCAMGHFTTGADAGGLLAICQHHDQIAAPPVAADDGAVADLRAVVAEVAACRRVEAELHQATAVTEPPMQRLVDSFADHAVFALDDAGRVASWNLGAERITGLPRDGVIGQHLAFFFDDPALAAACDTSLRVAAEQGRFEGEGWRMRSDGSRFWASIAVTALRGGGGELSGYAVILRDLTERRLAEEALHKSEQRIRLLVDSIRDYAIFMLDPEGRIQTWNRGAALCKGYAASEILGEPIARFYTPEDQAAGRPAAMLHQAAVDGRAEAQGWRVRKDGSRFWADVVVTALRDEAGELYGFAKVTRDLTERRAAEQQRLRVAQAEEAIRLRDEFLAIVSHELKTPLTGLQLQLEVLQERFAGLDERTAVDLARTRQSADRLDLLIRSLLDVSRLATGRLTLRPDLLDLGATVAGVVDGLRGLAARAACELILDLEAPLVGRWDRGRMEQVVSNLLSNAIRYGGGRPIEVVLVRDGDAVQLEVRDHGPGIAARDRDRVFDRFERRSSSRHHGGLGLGLYVAREIVNAHGGTITAGEAAGGGARLTVRLPIDAEHALGAAR